MDKSDDHVVSNSHRAGAIVLTIVIIMLIFFGAWVFTVIAKEANNDTNTQTNTQPANYR